MSGTVPLDRLDPLNKNPASTDNIRMVRIILLKVERSKRCLGNFPKSNNYIARAYKPENLMQGLLIPQTAWQDFPKLLRTNHPFQLNVTRQNNGLMVDNDTLYQIYMITLYILGYTARKKIGWQSTPGNKRGV